MSIVGDHAGPLSYDARSLLNIQLLVDGTDNLSPMRIHSTMTALRYAHPTRAYYIGRGPAVRRRPRLPRFNEHPTLPPSGQIVIYTNNLKSICTMGDNRWSAWSAPSWILFVCGPELFQSFQALNIDIFVKPQQILVHHLNYRGYDTKRSIIFAEWTAKFEIFTQVLAVTCGTTAESTQTSAKLPKPVNRVGEARLLLNHGQHNRVHLPC